MSSACVNARFGSPGSVRQRNVTDQLEKEMKRDGELETGKGS